MKYVLVTGAYGGMGKKTVEALEKNGLFVFALDKKIGEPSKGVLPIEADVTDHESIVRAYEKVRETTDSLFAIIHFAGIYTLDSLVEIKRDDFERAFAVNLFGAFDVNETFLPLLKSGSRIIITTSELATRDPLPFTGIYAVTKGALDKYAYSLKMELQLLGVSVSVLRAGAVDTDMLGASTAALDRFCKNTKIYSCNAKRFRDIVDRVEARRVPPEKIASKVMKIVGKKSPRFDYSINLNPLLILLDVLPKKLRFFIIRKILK